MEQSRADRIIWGKSFVRMVFDHKCDNTDREKPHWPFMFDLPTRETRAKNFED